MRKIDFVITWVDGSDKNWIKEKEKYDDNNVSNNCDKSTIRYRDWDNLKYWFRGVEKYAPWVNKIYFITWGHLPKWLNTNNDKLVIVNHKDYIPNEYLPTFNSNVIELMIHKIKGLEEQFVLFNDDVFLIDYVKEKDFFKNGKPNNTMSLNALLPNNKKFYKTIANNIEIINNNFNFKNSIKHNLKKYLSLKQGKYIFKTIPLLLYSELPGFANYHIAMSHLKSSFKKVWEIEPELLKKTMTSKFRNYDTNVNHWVFEYYQFIKGEFNQRSYKFGINLFVNDHRLKKVILKHKYKILCLSDTEEIDDFDAIKNEINSYFAKILPLKSSYEK